MVSESCRAGDVIDLDAVIAECDAQAVDVEAGKSRELANGPHIGAGATHTRRVAAGQAKFAGDVGDGDLPAARLFAVEQFDHTFQMCVLNHPGSSQRLGFKGNNGKGQNVKGIPVAVFNGNGCIRRVRLYRFTLCQFTLCQCRHGLCPHLGSIYDAGHPHVKIARACTLQLMLDGNPYPLMARPLF